MNDRRPQTADSAISSAVGGRRSAVVRWLVRAVVVVAFVAWSATHLDGFSWDYDEGVHVAIAWLVQQGHPLYTQTFSPYTPGFIVPLIVAFDWFGATMAIARMVTIMFATLGVLGVMGVAGELVRGSSRPPPRSEGGAANPPLLFFSTGEGRVGALLAELSAAVCVTLTPSFLQWSRAAMSDLPAAAVTALAVALSLIYIREQKLRWLFASEIVFAFALWVKLIAIGGAAALALVVLFVLRERRSDVRRALAGSLLVGMLAALPLVFFDVRGLYEQAIYFHIQKRAAFDQTLLERSAILFDFLRNHLTLTALAACGALMTLQRRAICRLSLVTCVWFAATFASLLLQTPLFANHHPVVLVFPLAALAGAGLRFAILRLRSGQVCDLRFAISSLAIGRRLVTIVCLLSALIGLVQYPEQLAAAAAPPLQPLAEEAVTLLQAVTSPTDLIVSDAQVIAFRAQRQAPPALSDTSTARLASGNLTADQLIAITQQSQANGILFWSGRLESVTPFVEWAERNYHPVRSSFQARTADYRLLLRAPHPQYPLDAQIGSGIRLLGYDLNRRTDTPLVAGRPLALTLYFQRTGAIERAYTLFVHLLAADGHLSAQDDHPPLAGSYLTNQWRMDEWIVDEYVLSVADDASAGDYQLEVGMYLRETLQRLPVTVAGARQPDDRLWLKTITIRAHDSTN